LSTTTNIAGRIFRKVVIFVVVARGRKDEIQFMYKICKRKVFLAVEVSKASKRVSMKDIGNDIAI